MKKYTMPKIEILDIYQDSDILNLPIHPSGPYVDANQGLAKEHPIFDWCGNEE